jgi:hypothetical protein
MHFTAAFCLQLNDERMNDDEQLRSFIRARDHIEYVRNSNKQKKQEF